MHAGLSDVLSQHSFLAFFLSVMHRSSIPSVWLIDKLTARQNKSANFSDMSILIDDTRASLELLFLLQVYFCMLLLG